MLFYYRWFYETQPLYFGDVNVGQQSGIQRIFNTDLEVSVAKVQQGFTGKFLCRTRIQGSDKSTSTQIIIGEGTIENNTIILLHGFL